MTKNIKEKNQQQPISLIEVHSGNIEKAFSAIGEFLVKEIDNAKVFSKDNDVFALQDDADLYFRISEDDYQIIGDKYKIIRMNDRRYIFERLNSKILSSSDELLKTLTRTIWKMSGKVRV